MSVLLEQVLAAARPRVQGRVARIVGLNVEVDGLQLPIGSAVRIDTEAGPVVAEVVAIGDDGLVCMPLGELRGVRAGDRAEGAEGATSVPVGEELLGRVLDGLGTPIDGGPSLHHALHVPVDNRAPHPLMRQMITQPLPLGVRALDTLIPCGRGQRMGIFAGSGVGKSTLLSMITRGTEAPVTVLALVGERGREVREFIHNDLGPEGLRRAVVVVATSDAPALVRLRAAFTA
ncbi:MAG TPA: EscN/YscN/HrcN family type III secretion system ATPase, partial [Acidimicrobiia bacterium]|nr:EscN/YscN/HrcN family type III secretion system ATPase [Acidimicrobiia bacterium]